MEPHAHPPITDRLVAWGDRLPERELSSVTMVVLHATELPDLQAAWEEAERTARESETGRGVCGHLYVDRDGSVHRFVPLDRVAFHVRGFNTPSVGIEIVNRGRYPSWFSASAQEPVEEFPGEQIESVKGLLRQLRRTMPALAELWRHSDLDHEVTPADDDPSLMVRRRIDPGPRFPWDEVSAYWDKIS